jgi:excisionase family DNA binding protein
VSGTGAAQRMPPSSGFPASADPLAPLVEHLAERIADRAAELLADQLPTAAPNAWLDVQGAADHLACEPHRVYDLVAQGRLRCAKDGRRSLFRREWLDAYMLGEEES